jgi:gliding motility-associated-like protein
LSKIEYFCISKQLKIWIYILLTFSISINALGQAPTSQSTNISLVSKYCSQATIEWSNGNGVRRIVVASKSNAVTFVPGNNAFYLSNLNFGQGTNLGSDQYVVYNGSANSVTIENLESNTTYHFAIYEYNQGASDIYYLTSGPPTFNLTTENITASFTMDVRNQCDSGNVTNFTGSGTASNGSTLSYVWDFDDGNTASTQNTNHTYADFGIYQVELITSSYRCEAIIVLDDTIAPTPVVRFELDPAEPNNTQQQCFLKSDGSTNFFKFKNNTIIGSLSGSISKTAYLRRYGDGSFDIRLKGQKTYSGPGIYVVRLSATSTQDSVVYCTDSFDLTVEVRQRPIDTPLISFEKEMCLIGNLFTFENNTLDGATASTWDFGDGSSNTGNLVTHSYGAPGLYYINLEVVDGFGCYDEYLDSVRVAPQPNNTFTGLASRYCLGDGIVSLQANLANGDWLGDNVDAAGNFSPTQLGTNTVRYAVNESGCKDTFTLSTEVFEVPIFELGNDTSICSGTSFVLRVPKGTTNVSWSTGDTDSFTTVSSSGVLWAQRLENGCSFRDSIQVQVISTPTVDLGIDSLLCGDGQRVIDVTAPEASYTWSDGYSGGGTRVITSSGTFTVTVSNKCGTVSDDVTLEFLPYVCDIFIPNAFSPNADGNNDVFQPSGNVEVLSMMIFDRWGAKVYHSTPLELAWDGTVQNVPAQGGHYYFVIRYLLPTNGTSVPLTSSGEVYLIR